MSTTEALRTQLDALQVERNRLMAQNRKLQDKQPERASAVDMEGELTETQEENVRLAHTVTQLEAEQERRGRETAQEREALEALTHEAAALRE